MLVEALRSHFQKEVSLLEVGLSGMGLIGRAQSVLFPFLTPGSKDPAVEIGLSQRGN